MPRFLSAYFPNWPILRRRLQGVAPVDAEFATVRTVRARRIIADLSPEACDAGLRPGMSLTQARAIVPTLSITDDDPDADRAALVQLAAWSERYTPLATVDMSGSGVLLDITGCSHLFGSEPRLVEDLAVRLKQFGLPAHIAVAGSPTAARALAHIAQVPCILQEGQETRALAALPVALLHLPEALVANLACLGLRQIGALARIPRADLALRFGPLPGQCLDFAFGHAVEPIAWPRMPEAWEERLAFPEPISTPDDLAGGLLQLTTSLCTRLAAAHQGGSRFTAIFMRVDSTRHSLTQSLAAPSCNAPRIARLLASKLETLDPGYGVDAIILTAVPAPLPPIQPDLADRGHDTSLADVIDELAQIMTVWRPGVGNSHIPEHATTRLPPMASPQSWPRDAGTDAPIRLFTPPEPIEATAPIPDDPPMFFRWRGALHRIRTASGPNRIAAEWWNTLPHPTRPETDRLRDYYRVEDSAGARFWVFRTGLSGVTRWFIHGIFG